MVDGHKSAAHTDSPDGGMGKKCFGRGMHRSHASSFHIFASLGQHVAPINANLAGRACQILP